MAIKKFIWTLFFKNLDGEMLWTLGMEFSVLRPTFTNKLLKVVAILLSSSITFPSIVSCEIFSEFFFTLTIFFIPSHVFYVIDMLLKIFCIILFLDFLISLLILFLNKEYRCLQFSLLGCLKWKRKYSL